MDLGGSSPHNSLDELHASLDTLASDHLSTMSVDGLAIRSIALQTARQRLDGILAATVAEAESAGVPAHNRQRTMAQFIAAHTHCNPADIRCDTRTGQWMRHLGHLESAALDGVLSRKHLNLLRSIDNIRVHYALQRDQQLFIELARQLEWKSFKSAADYWLLVNDPDGQQPKEQLVKNSCTITPLAGGRRRIVLNLDAVSGATVEDAIMNEASLLLDQDNEDGRVRTVSQRRAEAFTNICKRGANRSETTAKPLFHVVMSLKVLLHALAQLAKDEAEQDFTSVLDPNDVDGRCELIDGTPIHPKFALVLLMQARIRRQVLTAKSQTLNASVESRLFPTWMKYIKLVETRGQCETAGCDALHNWLQGDHRKPRTKQGQTTLDNLNMLCAADNKLKSDGPPLAERTSPHRAIGSWEPQRP